MTFRQYLMRPVYIVQCFTHSIYSKAFQSTAYIRCKPEFRNQETRWHRSAIAWHLRQLRKVGPTRPIVHAQALARLKAMDDREADAEKAFLRKGGQILAVE